MALGDTCERIFQSPKGQDPQVENYKPLHDRGKEKKN